MIVDYSTMRCGYYYLKRKFERSTQYTMAAPRMARTENTVARCEAQGPSSRPHRSLNSDIWCVLPTTGEED